jgi:hypothetical protein
MRASLAVELDKLRRRRAVWVLAGAWLAMDAFSGYALPYLLLRTSSGGPVDFSVPLTDLLPSALIENTIQGFPLFGLALAIVLGGLAVGNEYGWGTWTTVLVQRGGRVAPDAVRWRLSGQVDGGVGLVALLECVPVTGVPCVVHGLHQLQVLFGAHGHYLACRWYGVSCAGRGRRHS